MRVTEPGLNHHSAPNPRMIKFAAADRPNTALAKPMFSAEARNTGTGWFRMPNPSPFFYECRQWGECIFFLFLFSQGQWSTNKLARTGGRCENGL